MPNLDTQEVNCIVSNEGCELYVETAERVYSVMVSGRDYVTVYKINNKPVDVLPKTPKTRVLLDKFERAWEDMANIVRASRIDPTNGEYVNRNRPYIIQTSHEAIQSILREA